MADKTMRKLLVFGGNGFIGGETMVELLALNTFDITIINRGNWENYDSNIRIQPFVKTINIDRCELKIYIACLISFYIENRQMQLNDFVLQLVMNILMQLLILVHMIVVLSKMH